MASVARRTSRRRHWFSLPSPKLSYVFRFHGGPHHITFLKRVSAKKTVVWITELAVKLVSWRDGEKVQQLDIVVSELVNRLVGRFHGEAKDSFDPLISRPLCTVLSTSLVLHHLAAAKLFPTNNFFFSRSPSREQEISRTKQIWQCYGTGWAIIGSEGERQSNITTWYR